MAARLRTFHQWISSRSAILSISFECGQPNASGTLNPPMRLPSSPRDDPGFSNASSFSILLSAYQAFRDTFYVLPSIYVLLKRSVNETRKFYVLNVEILKIIRIYLYGRSETLARKPRSPSILYIHVNPSLTYIASSSIILNLREQPFWRTALSFTPRIRVE